MHTFSRWPAFVLAALAAGVAVLLWAIRDAPLLSPFIRIDGLGLFFVLVAIVGATRDVLVHAWHWRTIAVFLVVSALTLTARATPLIALGYIVLAIGAASHGPIPGLAKPFNLKALGSLLGGLIWAAPLPLAAACVAVGYAILALRGVTNYDDRLAGAALDSWVFWFVLLGAALALGALKVQRSTFNVQRPHFETQNLVLLWLYPLVRLYSLGPWNSGWGLATLLLGGAAALWLAAGALRLSVGTCSASLAGLALACFGLGTSAGIAAGCYVVLVCAALGTQRSRGAGFTEPGWSIGEAVAPFVAFWLVIGAAVAGGSVALAGVAWVAALLGGLVLVLMPPRQATPHARSYYVGTSLALGVGAPALIGLLITPAVAQLQGGLSAYGDVLIWPWVGLAVVNSAQAQVAVLPSVAVAVLMIVLVALLYLLKQLLAVPSSADDANEGPPITRVRLLDALRQEVPWLGEHHDQGRPIDPE